MNAITLYLLLSILNYELATEDFYGQKSSMFFFQMYSNIFHHNKTKNYLDFIFKIILYDMHQFFYLKFYFNDNKYE